MACHPLAACSVAGIPSRLWTCETPWDWAGLLCHLARHDERDLAVRMLANAFVDVPHLEQPAAVLEWVQQNIQYVDDTPPVKLREWLRRLQVGRPGEPFERFAGPARTLALGTGDCDDSARLVRAVLRSLGHRCRLVFVGSTSVPWHVTAAIRQGDGWYWLDASLAARPGEHPLKAKERIDGQPHYNQAR